jgi:hypothetical protein
MDINQAVPRVDVAPPVKTFFEALKTQYPGKYPVALRKLRAQRRAVYLTRWLPADKYRTGLAFSAYFFRDGVLTPGRAFAVHGLTRAFRRGRYFENLDVLVA